MTTRVYFTASGSFSYATYPDFGGTADLVEVIGGGSAGAQYGTHAGGSGGGGGAYTNKANQAIADGATITIGAGGSTSGGAGGDTSVINSSTILAKGAASHTYNANGAGGAAASCIPSANAFSGGRGQQMFPSYSGGGGGGAGSSTGTGRQGGTSTWSGGNGGSGGGGAGDNSGTATNGVDSSAGNGGAGGTSEQGTAGGAGSGSGAGTAGSNGSGGGGGWTAGKGGNGGNGVDFGTTYCRAGGGAGGGGGGGAGGAGGDGGSYGGGGGGSGRTNATYGLGASGVAVIHYTPVVASQYGRPASDIAANGWLPSTGSSLYGVLDETVADDSDYIYSPDNPSTEQFEVKLSATYDPGLNTGHMITIRLQAIGQDTDFDLNLVQGATVLDSWTERVTVAAGIVERSRTFSGAVADSITDYADLRVRGVARV